MRGIDISNWQDGLIPSSLDIDFCICKATEGLGYTDPSCNGFVQNCIDNGILWGFYHFARENEPEEEAEYFYRECSNYFGHGIPVLDYETRNYNDANWCERFITRLHELSGIWCMIYMSASYIYKFNDSWIPDTCGLWVAGYPYTQTDWTYDVMPYNIEPWEFAAIWQFTSSLILDGYVGKLDGNIAYMDADAWMKYASCSDSPEPKPIPDKSIDELAREVIEGKYGNDGEREKALGSKYDSVQQRVNEYYNVAEEVIRGDWGNGWNRKTALEGAGYDYVTVQNIVNALLGA